MMKSATAEAMVVVLCIWIDRREDQFVWSHGLRYCCSASHSQDDAYKKTTLKGGLLEAKGLLRSCCRRGFDAIAELAAPSEGKCSPDQW